MLKQVKQQSSLCTFWTFKYTSRNFLQFHILEIHFFNLYNSTMDRFKHFSKTNYPSGKGCHCWHLRFSAFSHLLAYLSFSAIMLTLVSIQKCTKAKTASLLFFVLDMVLLRLRWNHDIFFSRRQLSGKTKENVFWCVVSLTSSISLFSFFSTFCLGDLIKLLNVRKHNVLFVGF